jgi:hypothetical protein
MRHQPVERGVVDACGFLLTEQRAKALLADADVQAKDARPVQLRSIVGFVILRDDGREGKLVVRAMKEEGVVVGDLEVAAAERCR